MEAMWPQYLNEDDYNSAPHDPPKGNLDFSDAIVALSRCVAKSLSAISGTFGSMSHPKRPRLLPDEPLAA